MAGTPSASPAGVGGVLTVAAPSVMVEWMAVGRSACGPLLVAVPGTPPLGLEVFQVRLTTPRACAQGVTPPAAVEAKEEVYHGN